VPRGRNLILVDNDGLSVIDASRLRAAELACGFFVANRTTLLPVTEIARAAGISRRTFHRYFPTKAESVAPLFDESIRKSNAVIAGADPGTPILSVLIAAFESSLFGTDATRTRALMPLVFGDQEMWAVFMRHLHDGERSVAPLLAPRLDLPSDSLAARTAAAAVASAIRIALEEMVTSGSDPLAVYVESLAQFEEGPLRRRECQHGVGTLTLTDSDWQTANREDR